MDKRFVSVAEELLSEQSTNDDGSMTITTSTGITTIPEDSPLYSHLILAGTLSDCIARDDPEQFD